MVAIAAGIAQAQFIEVNGSPNVVGSGARASGMGGAFIAVADDATAASWNPGGLVQLERPELSLVYEYSFRGEDFKDSRSSVLGTTHAFEFGGDHDVDVSALNYLSLAYPFAIPGIERNAVVGLNFQRRYDFNRNLDFRWQVLTAPTRFSFDIDLEQRGSLNAFSPAFAIEITKRLSLGIAANIYGDSFGENAWEETQTGRARVTNLGFPTSTTPFRFKTKNEDFDGVNYTLGLLWNVTDRLSLGAVYHSPLVGHFDRRTDTVVAGAAVPGRSVQWRLEFPQAYGLGIAYRFPNDKLTVSMDVTRREWDNFVLISPQGRRTSPVTGLASMLSDVSPLYTVRTGFEYVFVDKSKFVQNYLPSIRAGAFYDPEPAQGGKSDFFGISLGAGVLIRDRVNIDLTYQYRFGENVRKSAFADRFGRSFTSADVEQHSFYLSTVLYF